ncbi:hypothetical protein QBC41DRAFT_325572 [Cercophora samala]|uniref:Uncharacterized protein n=1 Tax=Cercophora samala TaxID=330535 RepID=A0AA39Z975_9PEZI|nr:hypothetical protein QBC41DRAFT_325572 [Cercophora samala]
MDKVKDTMRKGFEKATKINEERMHHPCFFVMATQQLTWILRIAAPEKKHHALNTTYPAGAHQPSMVGGTDMHLNNAAHVGLTETGKTSLGQPSSKP